MVALLLFYGFASSPRSDKRAFRVNLLHDTYAVFMPTEVIHGIYPVTTQKR
jgi:hypothetical protein